MVINRALVSLSDVNPLLINVGAPEQLAGETTSNVRDGVDKVALTRILKCVLNYSPETDAVFHALSDPTRRRIVELLDRGPASVSQLAAPLPMSLPAVVQHLQVLEASGLVASEKVGRVRTCRLVVKRLDTVQDWIDARRATWERRLDRLGEYLAADPTPTKKEKS